MDAVEPKKEKKMYGKYDEWDINSAAETLMQAEAIKKDDEKMGYVKQHLSKKKKEIKSIEDLRLVAQEKAKGEKDGE